MSKILSTTTILNLFQLMSDVFTLLIMLPVVLVALVCFSLWICVKFPFWYLSRKCGVKKRFESARHESEAIYRVRL